MTIPVHDIEVDKINWDMIPRDDQPQPTVSGIAVPRTGIERQLFAKKKQFENAAQNAESLKQRFGLDRGVEQTPVPTSPGQYMAQQRVESQNAAAAKYNKDLAYLFNRHLTKLTTMVDDREDYEVIKQTLYKSD